MNAVPKKLNHSVAIAHLSRVDRKLARIILKHGECSLQMETTQSIFEALLESIVYQQLNGKVAATILGRVKALFPDNSGHLRTRRGLVARFPLRSKSRKRRPNSCAPLACRRRRCWPSKISPQRPLRASFPARARRKK